LHTFNVAMLQAISESEVTIGAFCGNLNSRDPRRVYFSGARADVRSFTPFSLLERRRSARMSRKAKIGIGVLVVLLLIFLLIPMLIGVFAKDKIIAGIQEAVGVPVKAGSVSVNLLPPGATIGSLEIGSPDALANNQPLAKIDSVKASVSWGTVFGGDVHVTGCTISGMTASISVDEHGVSSMTRLIDNMPPSKRNTNLPIDSLVLRNLKTMVFLAPGKKSPGVSADQADSTLTIDYASISNLVMAPAGKSLGSEIWSNVSVEGVYLTAPTLGEDKSGGGLSDGVRVGGLEAEFAQSPTEGQPIKVKTLTLSTIALAQVYTTPGTVPAITRASAILPLGLQSNSSGKKAGGVPELLVSAITIQSSKVEVRGTDAAGAPAYWRMNDLKADGANLAFGPGVAAPAAGYFKAGSPSESSAGPGKLELALTDISGSYPHWTFNCVYKLDGVAATAFSIPAQNSSGSAIKSGTVAMSFEGPAQNGNLQIDGSITLSKDLEVTGTLNNQIAKILRGEPIKTVRIRGTLDNPDPQFPDAFAGLAEKMFKSILTGGPMGVFDSAGGFMGTSVEQGVREASKGLEKGKDLLKKVPGVNGLFGK
jgi:hypothetical protein